MIPNDAPVPDDMSLYRQVHPTEIVWNENDGRPRPASGVFKDLEMSIHLDDVLKDEEREPRVRDRRQTSALPCLPHRWLRERRRTGPCDAPR